MFFMPMLILASGILSNGTPNHINIEKIFCVRVRTKSVLQINLMGVIRACALKHLPS
jgi:hypothetical protein